VETEDDNLEELVVVVVDVAEDVVAFQEKYWGRRKDTIFSASESPCSLIP